MGARIMGIGIADYEQLRDSTRMRYILSANHTANGAR